MSVKVGFIGTGSMGGAIDKRIVKGNADGKYKLFAYDINRDALDQLAGKPDLRRAGAILSWFVLRTSYSLPSSPGTQRLSWRRLGTFWEARSW